MNGKRILVVVAHPDDEVLGAGGTIARLAATAEVNCLILGEGATSRAVRREDADPRAVAALRDTAAAVARELGIRELVHLGYPDNRFDGVELLDLVKEIEKVIARLRPDTVVTHSGSDLNLDHRHTLAAVLAATRPLAGSSVRDVYAAEIPSATEWSFGRISGVFAPTVFVDISSTLERKLAALRRYESELPAFPHPRAPEAVRALAQTRGVQAGVAAAEAFELIRSVR